MSAYIRMLICMRTTLNLNDHLIRRAKQRAAAGGRTLTSVIEEALERLLVEETRSREERYRVPVAPPSRARPSIDLNDPRALTDLLDEEDVARFLRVQTDLERRATP